MILFHQRSSERAECKTVYYDITFCEIPYKGDIAAHARHNVSFLMSGMIDRAALMLSSSYTLRSIQIPSPIIYHRSLFGAGSLLAFSLSPDYARAGAN
jgi:hypothetical protein